LTNLGETIKATGPAALCQSFSGNTAFSGTHLDVLSNILLIILRGEHNCQSLDISYGEDEEELEEDLAELDALVYAAAADVVASEAAAIGPQFAPYFDQFVPLILPFCSKPSASDRSMAIGALAECADGLQSGVTNYTEDLLQLFMKALQDDDEEVRSNAAFGAGIVVSHTQKDTSAFFPQLLQLLHPLFLTETTTNMRDNACGAVARLIIRDASKLPLEQILPVLLPCLPLRDVQENRPVYQALVTLLLQNNQIVRNFNIVVFTAWSHYGAISSS
jgi:hypothetical protein